MVRSIQHLRQIVRVFIKHYGYTHFLNFQWANIILICFVVFFLARFARSILKQWAIMSGVTSHAPIAFEISLLQDRITSLEKSNKDLQDTYVSLTTRVAVLEAQADQAEQYSRRNCLCISGIPETPDENTDNIVQAIANDIVSDIRLQDIDRSHRIGNPKKKRSTQREIIVKFSTYRARANFHKQRTLMKERGHEGEFINKDLTRKRSEYLFEARKLFKSKKLKGAWSSDGTILALCH